MSFDKIICGFAGIGKSHTAVNYVGVVDLESTPFRKNWDLYANVAIHMLSNGYTPLVACHKEFRAELNMKEADYIVVIPNMLDRDEYIERYKKREDDKKFIELFEKKWFEFIIEILNEEENVVMLQEKMFLSDFLEENI